MRRPDAPPQWLPWLARLSLVYAAVLLFGVWPLTGGDLLKHLTVGRGIWEHRVAPRVDVLPYDSAGEFIAHSWLAERVFYLIGATFFVAGVEEYSGYWPAQTGAA